MNNLWCYTCDKSTAHEVRYRSDPEFIGKLLVCHDCGETVSEPLGGVPDEGPLLNARLDMKENP